MEIVAISTRQVKNYGNLSLVECYAGQLNQVFMNILANAVVHNGSAIAAGINGLRPLMHQDPPSQ